jgi:hypothetical protein
MSAAVKGDIVMASAAAAAAAEAKKRKIDDAEEFSDAQPLDSDATPTPPTTPIPRGALSTTTSTTTSSLGGSASQVRAEAFSADAPPGGHTLDSIANMIAHTLGAVSNNTAKVAENTNTTNTTAALVKKVDGKADAIEGDLKKLARRVLVLEGGTKGGAKGGKNPAVFNLSPRGADPLQKDDPWLNGRGNRAAGLGFAPEPRNEQETNDEWAAYANNVSSRPRPSEFTLASRPGDRTGLIFGGFKIDTDREDIEDCLRKIMGDTEGGSRASRAWESSRSQAR